MKYIKTKFLDIVFQLGEEKVPDNIFLLLDILTSLRIKTNELRVVQAIEKMLQELYLASNLEKPRIK